MNDDNVDIIIEYEVEKTNADKNDRESMLRAFLIFYHSWPKLAGKIEEAKSYLRKSALLGNVDAQYNLGFLTLNGDVFEKDFDSAVYWLEKSANKGYTKSKVLLGTIYIKKFEFSREDYSLYFESKKWFNEAALDGDLNSMKMYAIGILAFENSKRQEALEWLVKAASFNDVEAMRYLGSNFEQEFTRTKNEVDIIQAIKWYKLASELGDIDALNWIKERTMKSQNK